MEHLTEFRTALRHYVNFIMKQKVGVAMSLVGKNLSTKVGMFCSCDKEEPSWGYSVTTCGCKVC